MGGVMQAAFGLDGVLEFTAMRSSGYCIAEKLG